jgi:uncharacterized protein YndB with AHSA1/START domain
MTEPQTIATVETRAEGDRRTLVFVRDLRHAPERVWRMLTEPGELRAWAPYTADRSLAQPGDVTLTMFKNAQEEADELPASVTRAEPPRLLEYTLGDDNLLWELEPAGAGTRLTLSHTVAGPDWVPKVAAGWHICLDVADRVLDGEPVEPIRGEDAMEHGWQGLHDAYAERLGAG